MSLFSLLDFGAPDLAIDVGTANTLIYVKGKGIVINEPSVVAIRTDGTQGEKRIRAIGAEAKSMLGRTPMNITALRPVKDGVISNYTVTSFMLRYLIERACPKGLLRPGPRRVLACVPSGSSELEQRAIKDSITAAGAREVYLIEEPTAAAVGAGLPVHQPTGSMVLDLGGGTAEVGIVSLNGVVYSASARVGGDRLNDAIASYVRRTYGSLIGEATAEEIKHAIGSAFEGERNGEIEVRALNLSEGIPRDLLLKSDEILEALNEPLLAIVDLVKAALEKVPPDLSSDVAGQGIYITGGGALLPGIDKMIEKHTRLKAHIAEDPLTCVARGAGELLSRLDDDNFSLLTVGL